MKTAPSLSRSVGYVKPIGKVREEFARGSLPRKLGSASLVVLGVGVILGGGIFVLVGTVASRTAGPATALSFLLAAAGCALIALCYAELGALLPASGGAYTYAYCTFGEVAAWVVGWNLTLEYVFAGSFVAVGWSGYLVGFLRPFGILLPEHFANAPVAFEDGSLLLTGNYINLPAIAITLIVVSIVVRGISLSALASACIVSLKLLALASFLLLGTLYVRPSNWSPFVPPNSGHFGTFGWSGILRGTAIVFISYLGFDAIATTARECRNPQRDLPIGIFGSLAICGFFYSAVALVLTGLVPYRGLDVANPLSAALRTVGGALNWIAPLVDVAALAGLAAVLLGILLAQPRVVLAMSEDRLLPPALATLHDRFRTPYRASLLTAAAVALLAGLFPLQTLSELVSMGALVVFLSVCAGVLVLRRRLPAEPRPFRVPAVRLIAPIAIAFCLIMLAGMPRETWLLYGVWMFIGALIYFAVGMKAARDYRAQGASLT